MSLTNGFDDFHDMSACPPACLPQDPTNIKAMLFLTAGRQVGPTARG
jgi:ferritin-like protein